MSLTLSSSLQRFAYPLASSRDFVKHATKSWTKRCTEPDRGEPGIYLALKLLQSCLLNAEYLAIGFANSAPSPTRATS